MLTENRAALEVRIKKAILVCSFFRQYILNGDVAKRLRRCIANAVIVGSNPTVLSILFFVRGNDAQNTSSRTTV